MKISFKKNKILIGIIVIIIILFLLNIFQKEVRSFFYSFSAPIQQVLWQAGEGTADFFWGFLKSGDLKNRADQIELKNQELISQIIILKELEQENKDLRQALDFGLEKDFKLSLAQIISKDITQDFILVNKGAQNGIEKDMPVITKEKVLVGKISEIYDKFSKVMLISHKDSSFDVEVLNISSGIVKGKGNSKFLLDLIPQEKEISQGDLIITSFLGGIFPKGLLVGEIKSVKKSDVESFQQADIEPFFDISQTEILFIILKF